MNILVSGASGLVGKWLVKKLQERNHHVRILARKKSEKPNEFYWNVQEKYVDEGAFENLDAIIHLAGATISKRWTEEYKKELFESRISTANLLFDYCKKLQIKLDSFVSASGVNYYGTFTSDKILKESDGIVKQDFLANLCKHWEAAAHQFSEISNRTVCLRTAMVLAKEGGALPQLNKITNLNLGSAVGSGKQWMNWIHLEDLVNMYIYAIENSQISGSYNAVAENIPTNKVFMETLAKVNEKLFFAPNVPSFVMKMVFGEMAEIILEGTRCSNEKIKTEGFQFQFNDVEKALKDLQ